MATVLGNYLKMLNINESETVSEDKYVVTYTYDLLNPATNKNETKTGTVTFNLPVKAMNLKVQPPKKS
jgi:hypothetical protein